MVSKLIIIVLFTSAIDAKENLSYDAMDSTLPSTHEFSPNHGTTVVLITRPGIKAIESYDGRQGLIFSELSDGMQLWQLLTSAEDGAMIYCKHTVDGDMEEVTSFNARFDSYMTSAQDDEISTRVRVITDQQHLTDRQVSLLDFRSLRTKCDSLTDVVREMFGNSPALELVVAYRRWLGQVGQIVGEVLDTVRTRTLIYPSTKWCGSGNKASGYEDLGPYSQVHVRGLLNIYCKEKKPVIIVEAYKLARLYQ